MSEKAADPAESLADRKAALRERIRSMRRRQPPGLARARSLEAQQRLLAAECWRAARSVALYAALKGEMSTDRLLEAAWQSGRTVYLPRVHPQERGRMDFVACAGFEQLRPGPFGRANLRKACPALVLKRPEKVFDRIS